MANKHPIDNPSPRRPLIVDPARQAAAFGVMLAVLALALVLAVAYGSTSIALLDVVAAIRGDGDAAVVAIVRDVRVPTVLLAALVGAALGVGGTSMQGLLRNPLADPYLLGISAGAAVGTSIAVALDLERTVGPVALMLAAFCGSIATSSALALVAASMPGGLGGQRANSTLLLVGVVFNAFASALVLIIQALAAPTKSQLIFGWLLGTIVPSRAALIDPVLLGGTCAVAFVALWSRAHALNLLTLGDAEAASLGVRPARVRAQVLAATSVLVACAVSYAGLLGFVGLIVPHLVRLAVGPDHRLAIPMTALAGATFVVLADLVARSLFGLAGTMVPVGAVTACVGAPLFVMLLVRQLRSAEGGA